MYLYQYAEIFLLLLILFSSVVLLFFWLTICLDMFYVNQALFYSLPTYLSFIHMCFYQAFCHLPFFLIHIFLDGLLTHISSDDFSSVSIFFSIGFCTYCFPTFSTLQLTYFYCLSLYLLNRFVVYLSTFLSVYLFLSFIIHFSSFHLPL